MSESPRAVEAEEPATSGSAAEAPNSPDENEPHDMSGHTGPLELGEQFEVKEQDRWLPIANGMSITCLVAPSFHGAAVTHAPVCAPFARPHACRPISALVLPLTSTYTAQLRVLLVATVESE